MNIEYYEHFDTKVAVFSELKGKHRSMCLCYYRDKFHPGEATNCAIAQQNYEMCKTHHVVTPVFECPKFNPSEEKK